MTGAIWLSILSHVNITTTKPYRGGVETRSVQDYIVGACLAHDYDEDDPGDQPRRSVEQTAQVLGRLIDMLATLNVLDAHAVVEIREGYVPPDSQPRLTRT